MSTSDDSRRPWRLEDQELATELWNRLSPDAQRFLTILAQRPEKRFSGTEIGRLLHPPREHGRVNGLLGEAGKQCQKWGLEQIWMWQKGPSDKHTPYRMSALQADLITHAQHQPPLLHADDHYSGQLTRSSSVDVRGEQQHLRQRLLGGQETARCALCDDEFPSSFLVAAHLKRRSNCTDQERRDTANIAMLACLFGCDKLFEDGYLCVEDGTIRVRGTSPKPISTKLESLRGRASAAFTEESRAYFEWHRTNVFVAE
jgi:hypothetical protein